MGPGILDALFAFCQIPDHSNDSARKAEQINAQFYKLIGAHVKAGDQKIEDGAHSQDDNDRNNDRSVVIERPLKIPPAVFVAVMTSHVQCVPKLK
jgi:hypothetical protein